jgi:hypothetical protein
VVFGADADATTLTRNGNEYLTPKAWHSFLAAAIYKCNISYPDKGTMLTKRCSQRVRRDNIYSMVDSLSSLNKINKGHLRAMVSKYYSGLQVGK